MDSVLTPAEVEFFVDTMMPHDIINIGSKSWLEWHQRMQKLHQEAIIEAAQLKEEHVKESLVNFRKVPILVQEAILMNIWKSKILPHLLKLNPNPDGTFVIYSILYHEAVCVGLLELIMFHGNGCEALEDSALDLLDYSYESASRLLSIKYMDQTEREKSCDEINRHTNNINFEIGMRALTIIRYLSEYFDRLSLGLTNQMYNVYDVPVLLIQILLGKPWQQNKKQYSAGQWISWDGEAVCQVEAQVWLALRHLLLDRACFTHYSITDSRRSQLLRLQALISPLLLDQIAPLIELKQMLCHLAVSEQPSAPPKPVLLEAVLEMKQNILNQIANKTKKIAKEQFVNIFPKNHDELVEMAKSLSAAYNTDLMENFDQCSTKPCTKCEKPSKQRCSHCKEEWYCSRMCQVDDWPRHKKSCLKTNAV